MWKIFNGFRSGSSSSPLFIEGPQDNAVRDEWEVSTPDPKPEEPVVFTPGEILPKIRRMGEVVRAVNQKRLETWIDINQHLAENIGHELLDELLIDRWEAHSEPHSEDCAVCKRGQQFPQFARDHIVGMLGFKTVAAIELDAERNTILVYALTDSGDVGYSKYWKSFAIRPNEDTDKLATQVVCAFAEAILRYYRERIPV